MTASGRNGLALTLSALFSLGAGAAGCSEKTLARVPKEPAACTSDPKRDLRIWNFNLSHPDTVALKNLGSCPADLEGLEVLFDDRDDAFPPDTLIDCTVRLPRLVLPAGASIRISELPLAGEIDALANEVSGCAYPLTFNPDRGGVTYLCEGDCDATTLIDVVAHAGDAIDALEPGVVENRYREPPELRFGARFSSPLRGAGKYNDGLVRYQRVATRGNFPDFVASDWGLQSRVVFSDFEEGVTIRNVAAPPVPWEVVRGRRAEIVTTRETAMSFATSLRITHLGEDGVSDALGWTLDAFSSPRDLVYFARTSSPATAANLELVSQSNPVVELGFEPGSVGANYGNGERAETESSEDTWYRVELRDIDWTRGSFNLYVDGIQVGLGLEIAENERFVDELRIYSVSGGSTAYLDAVELWGPTYPTSEPEGAGSAVGIVRCGVPSGRGGEGGAGAGEGGSEGGARAVAGPTCDDIDGPSTRAASCETFCADWDLICCGESFPENYANKAECLSACANFTGTELCCRAYHGSIGGPERCRYALGVDSGDVAPECAD